ncbi:uncharacterized protein [Montipora capricornis]|uniref:uncharacterized protein n=1 Tax=Montipora capricornis TaxID=246305 RepID=UPI0035F1E0FA
MRRQSVRNNIAVRHENNLTYLSTEADYDCPATINRKNWVINLSQKPLATAERSFLEKGPKFAPTPRTIPVKDIVSEIEAAIARLPDDLKDAIRTTTAFLLHRARPPPHSNITKAELKALKNLKDDHECVIIKADKGNCFIVMDKTEYDSKLEALLGDHDTYHLVYKSSFVTIEKELNNRLFDLKRRNKIDELTYRKLRSTNGSPPAIRGSIKHHKLGFPLRPIFTNEMANMETSDDEVMVLFDVVSLFTAIPVTLSNSYFVYNNCIYKQIHGCAMGSPVSPIVGNLCMEVIEELAISTSSVPPRIWERYVDDTFVITKKDAVSSFHNTLNFFHY